MDVTDSAGNGAPGTGGVSGRPGVRGWLALGRRQVWGRRTSETSRAESARTSALEGAAQAGPEVGSPLRRDGLLTRVLPFAVVAALAELSLALPPGPRSAQGLTVSLVLLAVVTGAMFLPWARLPTWMTVLVPLAYTCSVLGLIEAAGGTNEGVGIVLLAPVVWTALFHRPWESAVIVVAAVAVEFYVSLFPDQAPAPVIIRRLIFWGALTTMIAVAAHGLRARIRRSQEATARLQGRLRELSIMADRDRIASTLQDTVVQRLFAAGLSLQGIGVPSGLPDVRRRIETVVHGLDEAIRLLRQSIFGLERGLPEQGLRRRILDVTSELTPVLGVVPEITLDGPIDSAVPARLSAHLLAVLRETLTQSGSVARATRVAVSVTAGDRQLRLTVTDNGTRWPARPSGDGPRLGSIRERARRLGGTMEIATSADGSAQLVWQVPLPADPGGPPGPSGPPRPGEARARGVALGRNGIPGPRNGAPGPVGGQGDGEGPDGAQPGRSILLPADLLAGFTAG